MLPPAMSVRCTMTFPPMRMPLGEPDCCFFVERPVSRDNFELKPRSAASVASSASWPSFFLYQRALRAAAHSGMPQDLLFIMLNRSANAATTISRFRSGALSKAQTHIR